MDTLDLGPATRALADVVAGIRDDQLGGPTPCSAYAVADLLDHVQDLAAAFVLVARKAPLPEGAGSPGDGHRLPDDWRADIARRLERLAAAWTDPAAYEGMTRAGPFEMPGSAAALVALDEVVVHGWDLARATGQPYDPDPAAVHAALEFVAGFAVPAEAGQGPFGPPVPVAADAPALDRLAGATGRDPAWTP